MSHVSNVNRFFNKYGFFSCIDFAKLYAFPQSMIKISNHTQTFLTFLTLVYCRIKYNFVLNIIYIASHLHVINDSWALNKPWNL
jgi:hypothetical protein